MDVLNIKYILGYYCRKEVNYTFTLTGKYANGIIAKTYKKGQVIPITIFLETTHHGWWEFRIGKFDEKRTSGDKMGHLDGMYDSMVFMSCFLINDRGTTQPHLLQGHLLRMTLILLAYMKARDFFIMHLFMLT